MRYLLALILLAGLVIGLQLALRPSDIGTPLVDLDELEGASLRADPNEAPIDDEEEAPPRRHSRRFEQTTL